jgi:hypothetical protein
MKKFIPLILIGVLMQYESYSQRLEFLASANHNYFKEAGIHIGSSARNPHENLSYTNNFGYAAGIGLNDIKIGIPFRFTIQFNHYSGGISYSYYGLGGNNSYNFTTSKNLLGIGIYPINLTWFERLKFSLGAEINYLIHAQQNGYQSEFMVGTSTLHSTIDNNSKSVNNPLYVGGVVSLSYEFPLSTNWCIAPQYMMYIPMNYEFTPSYYSTVSFRPYLGVALIKKLKTKSE